MSTTMSQGPKKRIKSKALTVYVDPKFNDVIEYLKNTTGLTAAVEKMLSEVRIDPVHWEIIKAAKELKEALKK